MYQSVIIFLNRRCPVGCSSCNAGAGISYRQELSTRWLQSVFPGLKQVDFSGYIVWTGGEPFLSFPALREGLRLSANSGYYSEILTSGVWYIQHKEMLESIAAIPGVSLRISLDAEHQAFVPIEHVIALTSRAVQLRLEVNFTIREIPGQPVSPLSYLMEIKKHLPDFFEQNQSRSRWLHVMPHIPLDYENESENFTNDRTQSRGKSCKLVFRDIVIGEDGLVYPCCGLFTLKDSNRFAVGDPLTDSWRDIECKQEEKEIFRLLKNSGPCDRCLHMLRQYTV